MQGRCDEFVQPVGQYLAGFRAAADVLKVIISQNVGFDSLEFDSVNNKINFHVTGYTMAQIMVNLGGERARYGEFVERFLCCFCDDLRQLADSGEDGCL